MLSLEENERITRVGRGTVPSVLPIDASVAASSNLPATMRTALSGW